MVFFLDDKDDDNAGRGRGVCEIERAVARGDDDAALADNDDNDKADSDRTDEFDNETVDFDFLGTERTR